MTKDPVWYYFVVPLVLLTIQVVVCILYVKVQQALIVKFTAMFAKPESTFYLPTAKEYDDMARKLEVARHIATHKKLVLQGHNKDA